MSAIEWNATIHEAMPAEQYHSMTESVSNSMRKVFRESPELFEAMYESKTIPHERPTKAKLFGVSVHRLVLEGEIRTIAKIPADVLTKSGAKNGKKWGEFEMQCAERNVIPLNEAEYETMLAVQRAIAAHPLAHGILFGAEARYERSIFWTDEDTGLNLRCRLDVQSDGPGIIADLKVLHDVSPDGFARAARKFGYDSQQYMYRQGALAATGNEYSFVFVCVCPKYAPKILVECYELNGDFQDLAESDTRRDLERIAICKRSGVWREPGWGRIKTVAPPSFARYEKEWEYDDGDGTEN